MDGEVQLALHLHGINFYPRAPEERFEIMFYVYCGVPIVRSLFVLIYPNIPIEYLTFI